MKTYPTITTKFTKTNVITFDKLDGSNVRTEWTKKKGFHKFGSRHKLIDEGSILAKSIPLMKEREEEMDKIFTKQNWERVVAFFEFYGMNSFAGSHEDEEHFVSLIDVSVYKKGMLEPEYFVDLFGHLSPKVLHKGMLDENLVDSVKSGTLDGMTFEGVVCKYVGKKGVQMFKIKSRAWIDKLIIKCNGNMDLFRRLV